MAKLLSILLQRNDTTVPWGFKITGGREKALPITILEVTPGTLAAQYLAAGDILLTIEGKKADTMLLVEVEDLVRNPGKSLDLLVQKVAPSRNFPSTPSSPNYFTFPGTPKSPTNFSYPGIPKTKKTPSNSSYPGTPRTPNTPSFPNSPSPISSNIMGISKTKNSFSNPGTPISPKNLEEMSIPKTSSIQKTQNSVNDYRELISPKTLSRPGTPSTPSTTDEVIIPKTFSIQKTRSSKNIFKEQISSDPESKIENFSSENDKLTAQPKTPTTPSIWEYKMKPNRKAVSNGHDSSSSDAEGTQWFSSVSNNVNGEVILEEQNQYMTEIRKKVNDSRRAFLETQKGFPEEDGDETSSLESFDSANDLLRERRMLMFEGDRRSEGWYGLASYIDYRRPISLPASPLPPSLAVSDEEEQAEVVR